MDKRTKQRLDMIRIVTLFCDANTAATAAIINFALTLTVIKNKVVLIDGFSLIADVPDKGKAVTLNVDAIRNAGSVMALSISGSLRAYAANPSVNNIELKEQMSLTITDFTHSSKEACLTLMNLVLTKANLFAANIANYGTFPPDKDALAAAVLLYGTAIGSSRTAQVSRKEADKQRKDLITQIITNDLENGLDALTLTLITKNKTFYDGYQFSREIIDSAVHSTRIKYRLMLGIIPVNAAESTIVNNKIVKKPKKDVYPKVFSTPEGIVIHDHLGTGLFDITIIKTGCNPKTLANNNVKLGNSLDLGDIQLTPVTPAPTPGTGNIEGIAKMAGVGFQGVLITIEGLPVSKTSDAYGKFNFTDLAPGIYNVTAKMPGGPSQTKPVTITANGTTPLEFLF